MKERRRIEGRRVEEEGGRRGRTMERRTEGRRIETKKKKALEIRKK